MLRGGASWQRLLSPGYQHVWACRAASESQTLAINHAGSLLQVEIVEMPISAFLADRQATQTAWIMAVEASAAPPVAGLRGPLTCVEVVKALLGIRAPFVLTPRQLARHLVRRMGAVALLPPTAPPSHAAT